MLIHLLLVLLLLGYGCATRLPATLGERASGYGYIPLDGLAVDQTLGDESCKAWRNLTKDAQKTNLANDILGDLAGQNPFSPLLLGLPDLSVRFAVASFDGSGGFSFGPAKITASGKSYRAILDYVNVDAIPVTFWITAYKNKKAVKITDLTNGDGPADSYEATLATKKAIRESKRKDSGEPNDSPEQKASDRAKESVNPKDEQIQPHDSSTLVTIPIYVGIGMRLTADITARESGVPLTSIGTIGLEAQAKRLMGTLTVQTIGLTGESIATALPLPSTLDQTTIENGILAIGSSRAVLYRSLSENSGIVTTPRIVGLYSPIGSAPALVNAIYSELSKERPKWERPCRTIPTPNS